MNVTPAHSRASGQEQAKARIPAFRRDERR
jgi:hypothetical protein